MNKIEVLKKLNSCLKKMDDIKKFGVSEDWYKAINHCKHIITSEFKDISDESK